MVPRSGCKVGNPECSTYRSAPSNGAVNTQSSWGDQYDSVQIHPLATLQCQRKPGNPGGTVALPNEILG